MKKNDLDAAGAGHGAEPGGDSAAEPANALEKIKADGMLTVALSPDFSPMV